MGKVSLHKVADVTNGRVDGDSGFAVKTISSLENADKNSLAFCIDQKHEDSLKSTAAGAVMLRAEHARLFSGHKVIVDDPYLAYARVSPLFRPFAESPAENVHPSAIISSSASIHANVVIGPYSVVGDNSRLNRGVVIGSHVSIGDDCIIDCQTVVDDGVRINSRTAIGARCNLASGVVLGSSGFGYAENQGEWLRIEQIGGVVIGNDVDIGANTTIDRGAIDNTVIGNGVKMDNQIQIAHNVQVGDHTIMAGCVGIAGSTVIGKRCRIGGRVSILGHVEITDDVVIQATSFVAGSVTAAGVYSAMIPAQPASQWRKTLANMRRLDRLAQNVKLLGKKLKDE